MALTAGAGLFVAGRVGSVREGIAMASAALAKGRAGSVLDALVRVTSTTEQRA